MSTATLQPQQAAQMGEALLAENKELSARVEALTVQLESMQGRYQELASKYDHLKEFEPLLEDAPTAMQIYLSDREVVRMLMARTLKAFGQKTGRHPDTIDKDDELTRRRARQNFDRVISGCLHYGLGPAWNVVYSKYIKRIPT